MLSTVCPTPYWEAIDSTPYWEAIGPTPYWEVIGPTPYWEAIGNEYLSQRWIFVDVSRAPVDNPTPMCRFCMFTVDNLTPTHQLDLISYF